MVPAVGRKLLWAYALLLLLAAVGYARYDVYMMDGDGTAFLDIAQALRTHQAGLAVNGYWNPGYPFVLSVVDRLTHPSLWRELAVVRYANVLIFALAAVTTLWFTSALAAARQLWRPSTTFAAPAPVLPLLALGLLTLSLGRELPVAAPRADTLLFMLLMAAGALSLRLLTQARFWHYPALGVVLGCAYLTKSFAFLPSAFLLVVIVLVGVRATGAQRRQIVGGGLVAAALFALIAGPYIAAISHQLGHFTTGDSARLNYAFFIDLTPRWHEWYQHDLGHARGVFVHPEQVLAERPPVFSFAAHPRGTFPLWFDPAWWTLGLKPHFWLKGHVYRLLRNVALLLRYLLGRPEIFVLLAVLIGFGASFPAFRRRREIAWRAQLWWLAPLSWGLLMLAIYFPVDLQDRYLTAPLFLMVLPCFAALESRGEMGSVRLVATATVVLFAGITLVQSVTYLADRRRHIPVPEQRHAGFDPQIFTAADGLRALGVRPGDTIACMGDLACYTDHYWARLAGAQILAEVETPNEANPLTVWDSAAEKRSIIAPLANMGLKYIVSLFPNSGSKPPGWVQLGQSNFFAYPLQGPLSPAQAAAVAGLQTKP